MTNMIKNDRGDFVYSVGAPSSIANLKCRRPRLLSVLESKRNTEELEWHQVEYWLSKLHTGVERWEYPLIKEYLGC